jgi:hypothetical protein
VAGLKIVLQRRPAAAPASLILTKLDFPLPIRRLRRTERFDFFEFKKRGACYGAERKMSDAKAVIYELRPWPDGRGYDLISDALPFGTLWCEEVEFAITYAKFYSQLTGCEVRVFNLKGELVETRASDTASQKRFEQEN